MKNSIFGKGLVFGIVVLFVGMNVIPIVESLSIEKRVSTGVKKSYMPINTRGNTLYVGGSGPGNYTRIQDAIDNASDYGDTTVFVYDDSSPYYENVVISKVIKLLGENRETTIIDGGGNGDVIYIAASSVTVSGFTIQNGGGSGDRIAGIELHGSDANHTYWNIISNVILKNNVEGLYLICAGGNTISDSIIINNHYYGIFIRESFHNGIFNNTISNNGWDGIVVRPEAFPSSIDHLKCSQDRGNSIYRNNISSNGWSAEYWGSGVFLFGTNENNVYENIITNNRMGVLIYAPFRTGCFYNDIYKNNITNNGYGVKIESEAKVTNNKIYLNNFIGNIKNAMSLSGLLDRNFWDNGSIGNFWDDYRGWDQNKDGIGDIPYYIDWHPLINKDRYPLMKPYNGSQSNQNSQSQPQSNPQSNPSPQNQPNSQPSSQQYQNNPSSRQINQLIQNLILRHQTIR